MNDLSLRDGVPPVPAADIADGDHGTRVGGVPTPDVSVTIVTYQCREMVLDCIGSLMPVSTGGSGSAGARVQVVVVDNASSDGVEAAVREQFPDTTVVQAGRNDGFGRSHNLAAAHATGRYLLVLNPDTIVEPGAIEELVRFADAQADAGTPVGVVAPRLVYPDGRDQRTARAFPTASAGIFGRRSPLTRWFPNNRWSRRFLDSDQDNDVHPWKVDWVSGAAMLIPRELFDELGGFDPEFFMHFEDAELCHRVAGVGRAVWCVPTARIVHDEGGTRGGWSRSQIWYFHQGAYLFARKSRYPGRWDVRRWATAGLLGVRLIAVNLLSLVQKSSHRRRTEEAAGIA